MKVDDKAKRSFSIKGWRIALLFVFCIQSVGFAENKPNSKFAGVQVGTITYSYRSMPDQSLPAILDYIVQSGINSVELMGIRLKNLPEFRIAEIVKC